MVQFLKSRSQTITTFDNTAERWERSVYAFLGRDIATMAPDASVWPSSVGDAGVTSGTFYGNLRRYLRAAGLRLARVHIFRHSAAKLRRDACASIENVSRFLDHSSLQVTVNLSPTVGGRGGREPG